MQDAYNRLDLRYAVEWFPGEAGEQPEPLLVPDLRVDDHALLEGFTMDLRELVASTRRNGEFWIFTCGCGEPGCAGIEEPVRILHCPEEVVWQIPRAIRGRFDEDSFREYAFNRTAYFDAVREALARAKQLSAGLAHKDCIGPYGFDCDQLHDLVVEEW